MKPFVPDHLRLKSEMNSAGLPPRLSTALTMGEQIGKSSLYRQNMQSFRVERKCKTVTAKHNGRAPATAETSSNYGMGRFGKSVQSVTAIKKIL